MVEWLEVVPALFAAVALVTLPGLPLATLLRFRGLTLLAASIAASLALIGLATVVLPLLGIRWGVLGILLVVAVVTVVVFPLRIFGRPPEPQAPRSIRTAAWAALGVSIAALLIGQELARAIGSPQNISQTYDGLFHLNAAADILLRGDASPLSLKLSAPEDTTSFYPTLWHGIVATISQVSATSIPVSTNILVLVTSCWIWPIGILFFSRPFFVRRPAHLVLGGILAGSFTAFPYLPIAWGVLYPNLLSTAIIPITLGFLYMGLRHQAISSNVPRASVWIAVIGSFGAATMAHPNAFFGLAAFSVPMLLVVANDIRKRPLPFPAKVVRWSILVLVLVTYVIFWAVVRTGDNERDYGDSVLKAIANALTNAAMLDSRSWFLTVLVLGGAVVLLIEKRHRWLIGSYGIAVALFVSAAGFNGSLRDWVTGAWYNDPHRLAALLPIAAIPLAAAASSRLLDYVVSGLQNGDPERITPRVQRYLPLIGSLVVCALILTGARGQNIPAQSGWIADLHAADGELLSSDERALLDRLPEDIPDDALIAGDPWTGTGLALGISNRKVLFGHFKGAWSDEAQFLGREFDGLGDDACVTLTSLGVTYLLDFGQDKYDIDDPSSYAPYSGLHNIAASPIVTEIDREGEAALYQVQCD